MGLLNEDTQGKSTRLLSEKKSRIRAPECFSSSQDVRDFQHISLKPYRCSSTSCKLVLIAAIKTAKGKSPACEYDWNQTAV